MQEATADGCKAACRSYRAKPAALAERQLERESSAKSRAVANLGGCRREGQSRERKLVRTFNNRLEAFYTFTS